MEITVEPAKTTAPAVSVRTTFAAVRGPADTLAELVTVTVFNAVAWPTLVSIILPVAASKVRF